MTASPRRSFFVIALAAGSAMSALACGASINAVYEGDVRFEHCMALDERGDVKATLRKSCWGEWGKYYTFGQTRDRVEYARKRQKQLSGSSNFDEGSWSPDAVAQRAVPETTTVLAPPPMMILTDAGRDGEGDAEAAPTSKPEVMEPPAAACAAQCRETWAGAKRACTNAACEKTAATSYRRCMKRCF